MSVEFKYKDITEKVIGTSFEKHKFLGNGFQEVIYQRALAHEMRKAGSVVQTKRVEILNSISELT